MPDGPGRPPGPVRPPGSGRPSALKNLGPTSDALLAEVGVETADGLRQLGAPMAYAILRHRFGARVNALFLYALAGALDGRHWTSYSADEKVALREAASGRLDVG